MANLEQAMFATYVKASKMRYKDLELWQPAIKDCTGAVVWSCKNVLVTSPATARQLAQDILESGLVRGTLAA